MENLKFDLKIKSPSVNIELKGVTKNEAKSCAEQILMETEDQKLEEMIRGVLTSFGFSGHSHGEYDVSSSAYLPREKTGEMMTCGRRVNEWGPWSKDPDQDEWIRIGKDRICSFCGSLHPRDVLQIIKGHGLQVLEPTSKNYKLYVKRPSVINSSMGGIKYYRHHDDETFVNDFNKLVYESK